MFATNLLVVHDTIIDLVYAVWDGSLDADATPSFEYILQIQPNSTYPGGIFIAGPADPELAGPGGFLLEPGDPPFRIILPAPDRLGVVAAATGVGSRLSVMMVQQ
jgi:hypothetical protein